MSGIPVVNLRDFTHGTFAERERFIRTFGDGLVEFGFVTVDRHEVPLELTEHVFEQSQRFFKLSEEVKRSYIVPKAGGARGYTAFGKERAVGASVSDLKEFWHVGQENVAGDLSKLYPANVWPKELPLFRPIVLEVYAALERVALQMLRAVALYLRLPETHFSSMAERGNSVLRIIHYPPVGADAHQEAVRAAAHEDINLITLLCEASSGGLEIKTRDGKWLPVSSLEGQIVVDAGDMLQLATNGIIPATTHRVVNPTETRNEERFSMPFFVHPRPEVILEPAPSTVATEKPRYEAITAHDYLTERLKAIGLFDADPYNTVG
ncbi:MAG: hypothetical protein RL199_802 [Pseudomonadota bacterium]|jgi:isopenicillin N synthase-like dioxygenase